MKTTSRIGATALSAAVGATLVAGVSTASATDAKSHPRQVNSQADASAPIMRIVSPLADSSVARGAGRPGNGSFDGSGFMFNVEVVTRDTVAVPVNESPNIRRADLLGRPNPNFPGFTATADVDLVKPDGGLIKAGTNLAALFNIAGTDDTPGPGVTIWAGWHVLESLPSGVDKLTLTTSVVDAAGRRSADRITVEVNDKAARSGQALTPAPAGISGDGKDDGDGPEVDLLAPRVPTRVATGPAGAPPPGTGSLFFIKVNSTDRSRNGIGVSENGTGDGIFRDPTQIAAKGPNRNMPGLDVTFDVPLRQPNGNLIPAGQNLAPIFDIVGSEIEVDNVVRTVADWVVGGSLELPQGKATVVITAKVTDAAGKTGSDRIRVGVSKTRDGQRLTAQPAAVTVTAPAAATATTSSAIPSATPSVAAKRLVAAMDGRQEISMTGGPGAGDLDGKGRFDAALNAADGSICYRLQVSDIDGKSRFHIHRGAAGVNGPIVVPFFETKEQARHDACVKVDRALAQQIKNNPAAFYVNVHNAAFPAGAIRGQLGQGNAH